MTSILPVEIDALRYEAGGRCLVGELSLRLEPGVRSVILGPNGAGKSLTLRMIHGLIEPTSGRVRYASDAAASKCAMVFDRPTLLRRSAVANVEYALALHGVARAERRSRALEALEWTALGALADRPARVLSAGEKQRLSLARAWALSPELLLLDEPTASLDPGAARAVEELILRIASEGTKVVMTTHDLGQARRIAEEVLFLHEGKLLERAPAARFFEAPASRVAAAFLQGDWIV